MSEKLDPAISAREVDSTQSADLKPSSEHANFFPWLEGDREDQKLSVKTLRRFPVFGAVGLLGSALTCVLSFAVLKSFDNRRVIGPDHWPYFPKPSAWLSAVIAINGILLHLAVSKGVTVSWWYRASKKQTTVADLHNVWDRGTSVLSAVTEWRTFDYIALATVLVAAIPVNGIVLQNAVAQRFDQRPANKPVTNFTITASLPPGFSGNLTSGSLSSYSPQWQLLMPAVVGNFESSYKILAQSSDTCQGTCTLDITTMGFLETCEPTTIPHDFPIDGQTSNSTLDSTIFSVDISWDSKSPYIIGLKTMYKTNDSCAGDLQVQTCSLQLGTVTHAVQVVKNTPRNGGATYEWSMLDQYGGNGQDSHRSGTYRTSRNFKAYDSVQETSTTTFGGIALALSSYWDSSIKLHAINNISTLVYDGFYAGVIGRGLGISNTDIVLPDGSYPYKEYPYVCNVTTNTFGGDAFTSFGSPADYILNQIRTTLFYTSIAYTENSAYQTTGWTGNLVESVANTQDYVDTTLYLIVWKWWGASVATTISIIFFILPTFYGFWTLARKTTLSPFETARAFHAPILQDASPKMDTPALLKEVGQKNLHTDFAAEDPAAHAGVKVD